MRAFDFSVSLVRQYLFCPRAAWHRCWLLRKVKDPLWMERGKIFHERQIRNYSRRRGKAEEGRYLRFQHELVSDKLGIYGVADLIIEYQKSVDVVEFKSTKGGERAAAIQAGAYALIAEEVFSREVNEVIIYTGDYAKPLVSKFDSGKQKEVREVIKETRECLQSDHLPFVDPPISKCVQCEFIRWCNDRI